MAERKKDDKRVTTIGVRLEGEDLELLRRLQEREERTASQIVRRALRLYARRGTKR